jgi:ArsR family transcriptional regulator
MLTPLHEAKADLFRALGHPVRVRALELLLPGPLAVHDLLGEIPVTPASLSQQLAVLRHAGLVTAERRRGGVTYRLATDEVAALMGAARSFLSSVLTSRESRLEEVRSLEAAL